MEHHSNIVPWQMLRDEKGRAQGRADRRRRRARLDAFGQLLSDQTKLVAVTHVSNALGTITPVAEIIRLAHAAAPWCWSTAPRRSPTCRVDVQALDCDFYVFSGHKLYGPTGIGVLYGEEELLEAMPP